IRWPGMPAGVTRSQLVTNEDLVATIIELAGAKPGIPLDGRSLASIARNPSAPWRTAFLIQGEKFPVTYFAVRSARYVYAENDSATFGHEEELYDLSVDPYQLSNQIDSTNYGHVRAWLRRKLSILKGCAGQQCWITYNPPDLPAQIRMRP